MEIMDLGQHMALVDGSERITPNVDRITYNEGLYFCKDSINIRVPVMHETIKVNLNFCINEETKELNGPIFNSYFKNTDYIGNMNSYEYYLNNLEHRVIMDYNRTKRQEFNSTPVKHWRFRK